eukprot:scaffold69807_cov73-Phaeocystis_antarctica.AAC.1
MCSVRKTRASVQLTQGCMLSAFPPLSPECKYVATPAAARLLPVCLQPKQATVAALVREPVYEVGQMAELWEPTKRPSQGTLHRCATALRCDFTARTAPPPPPLTALLHARSRSISWHRCTGPPSRMNDEPQPTNYTEACAKHLVCHRHVTGPVNGIEADGTAKQA